MKFVIENLSKNSGRLGYLVQQDTGKQFKTPLLLQTTKGGSIPYLSREVFDHVSKDCHVLQMSLATMDHMKEALTLFKGGLSGFVGFKDYPTVLTIRDPCETMPNGSNDKDIVPLFTRRGKETISPEKYIELVETFKPDIYQGLNDADTNFDSAKKRIQKSVDRTEIFMRFCYEQHSKSEILKKSCLFVPIAGGYNTFNRSQSIKDARANGGDLCGGYIFEGFHNYGLSASEVTSEQLLPIMAHCLKELLADSKPIMLPGAYTPLLVLELIKMGVDMFDSSYAYCAAVNFKALSFSWEEKEFNVNDTPFIDITDDCLREDFTPLLKDCLCLACQKHNRAYIHHLYKTSELLGPILLMIHNLHHLMQFFKKIHESIAADSLDNLIQLIKYQGGDKVVEYRITANTKVISKAGLGKGFVESKS
ncbi:queuine tRNA-ribosyltransferase accessory subunit 2 [Musca domestica]|uniref:Queuine tRNA-ribosyltransferase accessory subunit 2 n=1 Tax=Musca domestica TaxID=7370 RepID=A0A1I8MZG1_MUSDO|nr:queuine tRNA-ribosyltransferase accessory subunit 2 [Musca domestica]